MGTRSRGRGAAAAFGLLLLLVGIVGGILLALRAERLPDDTIDDFARAPVGCTTTLDFTSTGTFYVYQETGAVGPPPDGNCSPRAVPEPAFGFELRRGDDVVTTLEDASIAYESGGRTGRSVASFDIDEPGQYELAAVGTDATSVAAVGRAPTAGVDETRRAAVLVGAVGGLLGFLLLVLAGRRSRRAAAPSPPVGPVWGRSTSDLDTALPPPPPVGRVPMPTVPTEPEEVPPPLPFRRPPSSISPPSSHWAPPTAGEPVGDLIEPDESERDADDRPDGRSDPPGPQPMA